MQRFLVGRLLQTLVTVLLALTVFWVAVTVLPGDPVRALFGFRQPSPEAYAAVSEQLRLDRPVWEQYVLYLTDVLRLDLGNSFPRDNFGRPEPGTPVLTLVRGAAPVSAALLVGALLVQAAAGVVAGTLAAARPGTWLARYVDAVALLLVCTPVLVVAFVARSVVGVRLGWLPAAGVTAGWTGYVLPTLSLAAMSTGYITLLVTSELRLALRAPYVRAARARGIGSWRLASVHAMRPSLIPVATFVAANIGQLVTALLIVEGVFRVPGVGGLLFSAIGAQDRNVVVGVATIIALVVIVANALADVAVAVLDPRLRLST